MRLIMAIWAIKSLLTFAEIKQKVLNCLCWGVYADTVRGYGDIKMEIRSYLVM